MGKINELYKFNYKIIFIFLLPLYKNKYTNLITLDMNTVG